MIFAILSFAIQFPVASGNNIIKILEATSWGLLAATAILALIQIGGFSIKDTEAYPDLSGGWRVAMWCFFVSGLVLLICVKIASSMSYIDL